ncbi:MAG: c-type heme family protein [Desulfobacca sp.]|uniref:c-type heme family protein n=1 Tax=Desulfobacca sp. TaxID=2067990 RepID=UPI00404A0742
MAHDRNRGVRVYTFVLLAVWTLMVLVSIAWRIEQEYTASMQQAREAARLHVEKDLILREWNTGHGFVYAPVTPKNLPNPHLKLPEREIVTPSGKVFTAINSSLMIRQIYELAGKKSAYRGHLTSLQPLRPENAPDPWERQALEQFLAGSPEVSGVATINGQSYYRFMQPLPAEQKCLGCHANYTMGQVAGGLSVALPLASITAGWQRTRWAVLLAHGFLWLVGVLGVVFASRQMEKEIRAQHQTETALRQSERNYRLLVQNIPALVYRGYADGRVDFIDDKVEAVTGYSREDFSSGRITWPEIILPEDMPTCKQIFVQALTADGAYRR